jgi:lysozyme
MPRRKKKNKIWRLLFYLIICGILVMTGFAGYQWWLERRAHFVRYPEFGIDIPVNYPIHGIDVSKYQSVIDWQSVKDMNVNNVQISFVFIKATEGLDDEDDYFSRNWRKAKSAGLIRGAYHYFLATKSGRDQAENFINSVKLETGDMPPVLDIEHSYGVEANVLRDRLKEWLETIQNYYGVMPIIYTNVEFYKQFLKDDFDGYPLWVAHYLQKERPHIYRDWTFWQHDEGGRVNGIFTKVDFNVFSGDSTEFRKILMN